MMNFPEAFAWYIKFGQEIAVSTNFFTLKKLLHFCVGIYIWNLQENEKKLMKKLWYDDGKLILFSMHSFLVTPNKLLLDFLCLLLEVSCYWFGITIYHFRLNCLKSCTRSMKHHEAIKRTKCRSSHGYANNSLPLLY